MSDHTVVVERVSVTFGATLALDEVGLRVAPGGTLAVLGHNGAGKTTLVRVLTTAIVPRRGQVRVAGIDALARPAEIVGRLTGAMQVGDLAVTSPSLDDVFFHLASTAGLARSGAPE
ncbi:ATP-binding cassette domain-containing protein [Frankia sp. Cr2]|uniref:ATP-binding cassette domain-containing protein n=1 Tax=Frankia sp. Cr2 TaxID=3073932 RepID=UPI002AD44253|nr:ATP-binding cassette domain-containing protein [Frankia sp. Cr2]